MIIRAMKAEGKKKIPFAIDRKSPDGLAEQMTNQLRQSIVSGYYKTGDVGRYECAQLDHELRAKPDLVILVENRPDLERRLSKSKVPYCVFGPKACRQSGCALSFIRDPNAAVAE